MEARIVAVFGSQPGHVIVEKANEEHAQLVVMGTRGMRTVRRTLMGSVSDYVVHHAHCPVMICRSYKWSNLWANPIIEEGFVCFCEIYIYVSIIRSAKWQLKFPTKWQEIGNIQERWHTMSFVKYCMVISDWNNFLYAPVPAHTLCLN